MRGERQSALGILQCTQNGASEEDDIDCQQHQKDQLQSFCCLLDSCSERIMIKSTSWVLNLQLGVNKFVFRSVFEDW